MSMRPERWLGITIALAVCLAATVAAVNVTVDPYGLFRPTKGRRLAVYGDSRVAKYLLNCRYVPENFDAILIGTSLSANWNLAAIEGFRVYNNSLNGGNIVEGRSVARAALTRPGISTAFILVHPALTASHEFETVRLDDRLKRAALGSSSLWEAYKDMLKIRLRRSTLNFDFAGTEELGGYRREMNAVMKRLWRPGDEFDVDRVAYAEYLELVTELRAHGVQVVFIVPPMFEGLLQGKRLAFDKYVRSIRSKAAMAGDVWLDFTGDEDYEFRRNAAHFGDGVHFEPEAARVLVEKLNDRLNDSIARGRLRRSAVSTPW
jgi:hypothetical protein